MLGDSFNTLSAVLLNDFRDHVVDRSLNDHVGFSVFEDLNIGNLAAFDNDGNIDLTVVAIALTFVCAVFVGSRSGGHQAEAGEQEYEFFIGFNSIKNKIILSRPSRKLDERIYSMEKKGTKRKTTLILTLTCIISVTTY